jgi:hypothetical protein
LKDGGDDCEASAIKQANGVVEAARHDHESLGERILEAVFTEHATVKATVQGFLRAAHAVARHPNVPAKIKKQVEELRSQLAAHTWADLATDSGGTQTATEASQGIREALQSIARKQVRDRLREVDLGGVSVSEFETKLHSALRASLGSPANLFIVDLFEGMVAFNFEGQYDVLWGAPYKINPDGSLTIGKAIRVKRTCRYIPEDETVEQKPIGDREDTGRPSGPNEALREGSISESGAVEFIESGSIVPWE